MASTIGQRIERLRREHFVGRSFETELFARLLAGIEQRTERIVNAYGMAGMGKTYWLNRCADLAEEEGAFVVRADAGEALGSRDRWCSMMETAMGAEDAAVGEGEGGRAERRVLAKLAAIADTRPIVLLIDGYEEMGGLDYWFRTSFVAGLPVRALLVIAGRYPLGGPWKHEPEWNRLIVRLPLNELEYDDVRSYLRGRGWTDEGAIDAVWLRTLGHPLSLSLCAADERDAVPRPGMPQQSGRPLEALLDAWAEEAADDELVALLYAASTVRTFHQELLGHITGGAVGSALFGRLTSLSFVARVSGGWQLHELVREALRGRFRERQPETFERCSAAAAAYYESRLMARLAAGADCAYELAELLRYAGNAIMRAHYRHSKPTACYVEPADAADGRLMADAERYVERRLAETRTWRIRCSDPETGTSFRYELPAGIHRQRLPLVPVAGLLAMDPKAIRLIRSAEGEAVGLIAAVTIGPDNVEALRRTPGARAFFRSLDARRLADVMGGVFIFTTDVANLEDEGLRAALVRVLFAYVLEGRFIALSPPPHAYFEDAYASYGFEAVAGADHDDYGEGSLARTFALDTRREKLVRYLRAMVPGFRGAPASGPGGDGVVQSAASPDATAGLTQREREVAGLLAAGRTNAQIAAALFVSEAAVKKHVNAMLSKFGLSNRTQLAHLLLSGPGRE